MRRVATFCDDWMSSRPIDVTPSVSVVSKASFAGVCQHVETAGIVSGAAAGARRCVALAIELIWCFHVRAVHRETSNLVTSSMLSAMAFARWFPTDSDSKYASTHGAAAAL